MKLNRTAITILYAVAVAPLALAQQPAPPKPREAQQQPRPEGNPRRTTTGILRQLDAETGTITFEDPSGKTVTWSVDKQIAQNAYGAAERRMNVLKPGDPIRVVYNLGPGGKPNVIDIGRNRGDRAKVGEDGRAVTPPAPPAPPR